MSVVTTAVGETASATRLVFANPNLRRVNLALAGSMIGDWAYATAVTVFAYRFGGPTAVGAYVAVRLALIAVGLPFGSTLVDRLPRKTFMIMADLVRAALITVAAVLIWTGAPPVLVLVLAVVAAVVGAPFRPAQAALLPALADTPQELTAANAISSTLESLAFFVGPALAGTLLTVVDVPVVFLLNAVSFGWSILMISGITLAATTPEAAAEDEAPTAAPGFLAEVASGFRVVIEDRRLSLVALLYSAQTVDTGASTVFTVVVAVEIIRSGPQGVGFLDAVMGVGAVIGGLVALSRSARGTLAQDFGAGVFLWAAPPLLIAFVPVPAVAFVAMALIGLANPLADVNAMTLLQRLVPERLLGRVFGALEAGLIGFMALGAFVTPFLLRGVGLRWTLVVVSVPSVVVVLLALPALRRLDRTVGPPPHLALVSGLPLFAPLAPAVQEDLARRLARLPVAAGDVVVEQGDVGELFYLVESGRLDARQGARPLSTMGPGECFGEIALLRDVPRTATVVATEACVLQTLTREDFLSAVGGDVEAGRRADSLITLRLSR